ncbi:DCC1-like thiol-disulfide oxidoreductase family protein [Sulfurimonas sp.]|uniref:thiol-disulfide oxidoreductase DCC family protein n=1 Tax=Sulfurimonas sp. TaxID=2022749 RepID=UPI0025DCE912|nr:DCC1-like thiol-disulfide oxidoreductase family protein [Sulfurimonas sp.]
MSKIILFDGICNLCNGAVNFVIKHDKNNLYHFASLQSDIGQEYLKKFNLSLNNFDTFILIDENEFYTASTASLMIAKNLSGFARFLYPLIYIPKSIRDVLYRLLAKNRYSLFGKANVCKIPRDKDKNKFLN